MKQLIDSLNIRISLLALFLLGNTLIRINAQVDLTIASAQFRMIKSEILGEDRYISVFLPDGYIESNKKYPVLYLLDGENHLQHASGASIFLADKGSIPGLIVVAVHNIDRNRDFTPIHTERRPSSGGGKQFLSFLSNELFPYIKTNYRTSNYSILFGHSLGGTFAVYTLLKKPELFDAYIAVSPFLQFAENYMVGAAQEQMKTKYKSTKSFYMTVGNEPNYFENLETFSKLIEERGGEFIQFKYVKMPDENHATVPYVSLFEGLRFTFSDWELPAESYNAGLEAIDQHYHKISKKYDHKVKASEYTLTMLGYAYLQKDDVQTAIEVFLKATNRYPNSANVHDSLGEAYEKDNQLELAKKSYAKACKLGEASYDPNLPVFKKNLQRVSGM